EEHLFETGDMAVAGEFARNLLAEARLGGHALVAVFDVEGELTDSVGLDAWGVLVNDGRKLTSS
ncbi:MAG TPA: hypothetical protein VFH17_01675, partial [Coriobacteriia bacterium]|nr:hypothetical protein [Coriobacteriia bacterium]